MEADLGGGQWVCYGKGARKLGERHRVGGAKSKLSAAVGEHVLGGNARTASNGVEGDAFAK